MRLDPKTEVCAVKTVIALYAGPYLYVTVWYSKVRVNQTIRNSNNKPFVKLTETHSYNHQLQACANFVSFLFLSLLS